MGFPKCRLCLLSICSGTTLEEKLIHPNEKDRREITITRATMALSLNQFFTAATAMKICPNAKCSVFGHIVYTVATRCPLCKWDLKAPLPASEIARAKTAQAHAATR